VRGAGLFVLMTAAVVMFGVAPGGAEPVRCSNESKTCLSACATLRDKQSASACINTCQARMASCQRTGCWDDGSFRYCGLLRQ
jgi:hypothetical protein